MSDDDKIPPKVNSLSSGARTLRRLMQAFEKAAFRQTDGTVYWLARDLAHLLKYSDFRNFLLVVEKAQIACQNSGMEVKNHFVDVTEMVVIGSGAKRTIEDMKLSRYACYLTAQNADARKRPVAFAQTYFAVQTQRQEQTSDPPDLSGAETRVRLRKEIADHNRSLASAARLAGVVVPLDYAVFQNAGYRGLYDGLDRVGIQKHKGLKSSTNILDHMGSTELAANLFRATQAEDKLRREQIRGKDAANKAHYNVGQKVRQTIRDIGGTMPENLAVEEDVRKLEKRLLSGKPQKTD